MGNFFSRLFETKTSSYFSSTTTTLNNYVAASGTTYSYERQLIEFDEGRLDIIGSISSHGPMITSFLKKRFCWINNIKFHLVVGYDFINKTKLKIIITVQNTDFCSKINSRPEHPEKVKLKEYLNPLISSIFETNTEPIIIFKD